MAVLILPKKTTHPKMKIFAFFNAFIFISLLILLDSCSTTELTPAFVRIDTVYVQTNANQGSASHNVQTVWVYANDQPVGVFELPTVVPILEEGSTNIVIFAGINQNGSGSTRIQYPYYTTGIYNSVDLQPGQIITLNPTLTYRDNTNFAFINDFELGNNITDTEDTGTEIFSLTEVPTEVFEGLRCGKARLTTAQPALRAGTNTFYPLPGNNSPTYVEMNYKCDIPFRVLLRGTTAGGTTATYPVFKVVNARDKWNKIYLDFTDETAQMKAQGISFFQILIEADLPADSTNAYLYWDNVKLMYQ